MSREVNRQPKKEISLAELASYLVDGKGDTTDRLMRISCDCDEPMGILKIHDSRHRGGKLYLLLETQIIEDLTQPDVRTIERNILSPGKTFMVDCPKHVRQVMDGDALIRASVGARERLVKIELGDQKIKPTIKIYRLPGVSKKE